MKKTLLAAALLASVFVLPSCGNDENASNKMAEDQNEQKFDSTDMKRDAEFAMKAASGGMMEVELGNMAAMNGVSPQVKEFGKNMVADHSKANEELKSAAAAKNITLPSVPDADMQKKIDDMKKKTGADFDKAYVDMMVSDHKDDIDLFQKEADKGNDPELKAWAAGKVPVLQHHLMMIEDIQKAMKN